MRKRKTQKDGLLARAFSVEGIFVVALLFLGGTVLMLGLASYRLTSWSRVAAPAVSRPMTPAAADPHGTGRRVEIVLHLRDQVAGIVWLSEQDRLAPDATQLAAIAEMLPEIQKNLQSAPGLVDADLEKKVSGVLAPAQLDAIRKWFQSDAPKPDYMASFRKLQALVDDAR